MKEQDNSQKIQVYLFFAGRCEEAIEFYKKAVGAQVSFMMRHKESPEPPQPGMLAPGWENKVMHSTIRIGNSDVMASDGCGTEKPSFTGFSLSISAANPAEAERFYSALSQGGEAKMPLMKTFFSPSFGMLVDKFGVSWMIMVRQPMQ